MTFINEKTSSVHGMTLHTVQTKKFKTNALILKLKSPLVEEDVTHRAILPYVLQRGTKSYPTTGELRKYLDDLYGSFLHVDLSKKGENHIITFRLEIPNERYLTDSPPLLEEGLRLLSEVILNPRMENGYFDHEIVEQEKRTLSQRIQAAYDDKMRYANLRLVQEMCKNEPYRLHVNGEREQIAAISTESLTNYYQKVVKEDEIDLYVVGDVSHEEVEQITSSYFKFQARQPVLIKQDSYKGEISEKEIIEEQDVKQGKLNIGFRTHTRFQDEDYFALQLFNGIFGGFSHSKLFINVREKASLAYYAASRVESHKGLLMVMSGIEVGNYEKTVTIIKEQMEAMKAGEYSDKEINQTKAVIQNQLLETIDTAYGMVELLYHQVISQTKRTVEEWLTGVNKVTKEDLLKVGQKIELDTIYFLKGMGGSSE
ncbi:EF-P 5-aminopentanol modification-associated protein YfmF [Bacillus kexueae]|uniref:EF-P 5-aminopentanol modification-associated protein YfmF n=1 Tax=Aeribacillus kexueae TaxID=2078952 RepID=UPI001FAECE6A|nr:pitrilysin family protein [Bacillus kexueae]